MQEPKWLKNRKADHQKNIDLENDDLAAKKFSEKGIAEDFSIKMIEGTISGYQAYYEYANRVSVEFSSKVAKCRSHLKSLQSLCTENLFAVQ